MKLKTIGEITFDKIYELTEIINPSTDLMDVLEMYATVYLSEKGKFYQINNVVFFNKKL